MFCKCSLRAIALSALFASSAIQAQESLDRTVAYLISYVAQSHATFIRNDVEHTGAEAAAHIKAKYQRFKNQIRTPEDFIRLAASKSLLSGKPYLVRTKTGKEMQLDQWLGQVLKRHQQGGAD